MRRLYITLTWNSQILSFLRTWTARRQAQTSSPLLRSNQISYWLYWMRLSVPWRSRGIQYNQGVKREGVEASGVEHMVGHLFQNYDTIYVRYFPTYTCNHSCYTIYVRFFATYTCVLSCFVGTNAHIYAHKKPIYMRYKQACGIWGHRKSSYKRHRIIPSAKNPFMYDGAEK